MTSAGKSAAGAEMARQRFELENGIQDEELFAWDQDKIDADLQARPWKKDPNHFKHIRISEVALIKMVMHAKSGGDLEVMGYMQGYPRGETMYVLDVFALPVEGTETRVSAGEEANVYTINHMESCEKVQRPENVVGWYHTHPGYGCWLSGIDVGTQKQMQMLQDPCLAIVIDPFRTMASGKVEIGCFRTFPDAYAEERQQAIQIGGAAAMPAEKFEEFGLHAHKYYKIEHSFFKSGLNTELLERIWLAYWQHTLSSSPLLSNQETITKTMHNLVGKVKQLPSGDNRNAKCDLTPIIKVSNQVAGDMNAGIMLEILKRNMFACNHEHSKMLVEANSTPMTD